MKYLIAFGLILSCYGAFGYSDTVVIKDMFGNKLTECSGLLCRPTFQGQMEGFSRFDKNWGGALLPRIEHNDGTETECIGMFCERKKKDNYLYGF
ncbi:MAG: hypothetical protein OXM55_03930 [Bdellovibrionales bacterium]|nr:hypothetical protein [Bdellovibrionales bacterium]